MVYLLDTNILVHYIRDSALARRIEGIYSLRTQATGPIISVVTEGEIESLALQLAWGAQRRARMRDLLGRFISVPLDYAGVIDTYARISTHTRHVGVPMGDNDLWIAATSHATGARLLTTDKDFDHLHPTFVQRDWIDPRLAP
jgi:tRNA(fMet)-specific endonuclease VapC